jgi:hypothetical protein
LETGCRGEYLDLRGRKWHEAREVFIMRFIIVRFTKYYWDDQIKEDEICGECNMNGRGDKLTQNFGRKTRRERD